MKWFWLTLLVLGSFVAGIFACKYWSNLKQLKGAAMGKMEGLVKKDGEQCGPLLVNTKVDNG